MTERTRSHGESATRRRRALLDAAMELIAENGAGVVTHRGVAERAGLPPSTTSYFFDSIDSLISEALRTYVAERIIELTNLAAELPDGTTPASLSLQLSQAMHAAPQNNVLALIEVYLGAARDPDLRAVVVESLDAFRRVATTSLRAAGARRAQSAARAFHALLDGFMLQHAADPRDEDEEELRRAILALYVAYAMSDAELTRWEKRLGATFLPDRT
jgi:DNA-binding transcriptional regulator YbjK